MNRSQRAIIAEETLAIIDSGQYQNPGGHVVPLAASLRLSVDGTVQHRPDEYESLERAVASEAGAATTSIGVSARSTLAAGRDLRERFASVACLNFASAKNPGGGFLSGSQAQEESLARASGLYACLREQSDFYEFHRHNKSLLYSDRAIFSPEVPVFRDDSDVLLSQPWHTSFITCAAVNAVAIKRNEPQSVPLIRSTMERRARMVLLVAARHGCEALVLGAWGCGVFGNDAGEVARIWRQALYEPLFQSRFAHVEFAIFDPRPPHDTLRAFERVFV